MVGREHEPCDFGGTEYAREDVVEVMGDAAGKRAERFHLLRVAQLVFQVVPGGDVRGDSGIALLANMITLTPGTTSLHVSEDRKVLYVHVMNLSDETVGLIKSGFERRVREVLP